MITSAGDAAAFMRKTIRLREERWRTGNTFIYDSYGALSLAALERLALEMAVHEDAERVALQGELEALEATWRDAGGSLELVRAKHLSRIEFIEAPDESAWVVRVVHDHGIVDLKGQQAMQTAGQLLALMNAHGGSATDVSDAADMITDAGDAAAFMRRTIQLREERWRTGNTFLNNAYGALSLAALERLALEMAVHEDAERVALQGELEALETAWRDAEEIAAISDSLLVPEAILHAIARFRTRLTGGA